MKGKEPYFYGTGARTPNAMTTNPTNIANAKADMAAAMNAVFASDGKAAIQAGIVAWWARLSSAPVSYFSGASDIQPPSGLNTIASSMEASVFVPNRLETSKAPAMDRMSSFLHVKNAGGTARIAGQNRVIT